MKKRKFWSIGAVRLSGFGIAYFLGLIVLILIDGLTWDNVRLLLGMFLVTMIMMVIMTAQERKERSIRSIIHMSDARLESLRRKEG